jgi:hypothetical protein
MDRPQQFNNQEFWGPIKYAYFGALKQPKYIEIRYAQACAGHRSLGHMYAKMFESWSK